jgi:hypothetical protein
MDQEKENKEEIDLSGAMKDSDTGVKFQDEWRQPARSFYPGTPKIIQWLIKYSGGLIKDEKQAQYVLLGFIVLAIIVSLFLFFVWEVQIFHRKH